MMKTGTMLVMFVFSNTRIELSITELFAGFVRVSVQSNEYYIKSFLFDRIGNLSSECRRKSVPTKFQSNPSSVCVCESELS